MSTTERCSQATSKSTSASVAPRRTIASRTSRHSSPSSTSSSAADAGGRRPTASGSRAVGVSTCCASGGQSRGTRPVQPQQGTTTIGDIGEATPRREEHLGDDIIDGIGGHPPPAIVAHRPVIVTIELAEPGLVTRAAAIRGARPSAHDMFMPSRRVRLRGIFARHHQGVAGTFTTSNGGCHGAGPTLMANADAAPLITRLDQEATDRDRDMTQFLPPAAAHASKHPDLGRLPPSRQITPLGATTAVETVTIARRHEHRALTAERWFAHNVANRMSSYIVR